MASISLKYKSKQGSLTAPGDVDPGAMIPIVTTTLSTSTSNVTFTDIPQSYEHLQIRAQGRTDRTSVGDYISIQFNGVTTTTYALHELIGDGSTASVGNATSATATATQRFAGASATSNVFGVFILDILDYTNTNKNTTIRGLGGIDNNGSGIVSLTSGLFNSTNAVTSIKFFPGIGTNFAANTTFALYGIKRAGA